MAAETVRSRFQKVMRGEKPADRLPVIEWASWWNLTVERWRKEGVPADLDKAGIKRFFGLDMDYQLNMPPWEPNTPPKVVTPADRWWVENEADYEGILPTLYANQPDYDPDRKTLEGWAKEQAAGEAIIWVKFSGFFWWPRVLFGVEHHLFAFYDQAELMHRINRDYTEYFLQALDNFNQICTPDFVMISEDMAFNYGPMISKPLFDEFLKPYYLQVVPRLKELGIVVLVDSDGAVEPLLPWLEEVGVEGCLPLERQAGVDVNRIRAERPEWRMIGGFDKTIMHLGEAKLREEFERIFPVMQSGYYIPAVDHQTPPAVSVEDYRLYVRLMREYAEKACQ
jgi:hypothetical protein